MLRLKSMIRKRQLVALKRDGLTIADDCLLNGWPIWGSEPYLITIGRGVTLAGGIVFLTHDGGIGVFKRDRTPYEHVIKFGRINIRDNCFIGYGAILMPGVSIGPNSVVAAGAVVTKSIPPDSVAAGVPARVVMSVAEYAEKALKLTPDYDHAAYRRQMKQELLRTIPEPAIPEQHPDEDGLQLP